MSGKRRFGAYPARGTITIGDGEQYPFAVAGTVINVKQADAPFTLRLDGVDDLAAAQNRRFRFPDAPFKHVMVINNSGGDLTFQLEIGFGDVESDDISITGTVKTDDDATQALLNSILTSTNAITAMLQNGEDLSAGVADMRNATYAYVEGSSSTEVLAAANTNGILIHFAQCYSLNGNSYISVGGDYVLKALGSSTGGRAISVELENKIVKAGGDLVIHSDSSSAPALIIYEVL